MPCSTSFLTRFQIRFLSDPTAEFVKALDLHWEGGVAIFGGPRSKRFALKIEDGKVAKTHIEPDDTGANGKPWSCDGNSLQN